MEFYTYLHWILFKLLKKEIPGFLNLASYFEIVSKVGCLGGSAVECLPPAQVVTPGSWDRVPHQAPCMEPASPSAWVSASLCVSLTNK